MKELPKFDELEGSTIEIEVDGNVIQMSVDRAVRGRGDRRFSLTLVGKIPEGPYIQRQCYVLYNDTRIGGSFTLQAMLPGVYRVDFNTIVAEDSFWL